MSAPGTSAGPRDASLSAGHAQPAPAHASANASTAAAARRRSSASAHGLAGVRAGPSGGTMGARAGPSGNAAGGGGAEAAADYACDRCHAKRKYCNRARPACKRCAWGKVPCTYDRPKQRRPIGVGVGEGAAPTGFDPKALRTSTSPGSDSDAGAASDAESYYSDVHSSARSYASSDAGGSAGAAGLGGDGGAARLLRQQSPLPADPRGSLADRMATAFGRTSPDIAEWISKHMVPKLPSAAAATRAGAVEQLELTLPDYMLGYNNQTGEHLEAVTQVADWPATQGVPQIFRRLPQQPGAVEQIQRGKQVFFYDDAPRAPGPHVAPELRERPLRIGKSVYDADPNGFYVLLLDEDGILQAVSPDSCTLDSRTIFEQEWTCPLADGTVCGPPWADAALGPLPPGVTLWPSDVVRSEESYSGDMRRARAMLGDECTAQILEYGCSERAGHHFMLRSQTNEYLRPLVRAAAQADAVPHGWTRIQTRQRQAFYLALQAQVPQGAGPFSVTLGGLFDPDVPAAGDLLEASISGWEYGFAALQLAWRLLQPRAHGRFDAEELGIDGIAALIMLTDTMRASPHYIPLFKAVLVLVQEPQTQAALRTEAAADPAMQEVYRRLVSICLVQANALRFWKEKDFPTHFGALYEAAGQVRLAPTELLMDEAILNGGNGANTIGRHRLRAHHFQARLAIIDEALLNSALLTAAGADASDAETAAALADADRLYEQYTSWYRDALAWKEDKSLQQFDRALAERIHGRWAFLFPATYGATHTDEWLIDFATVSLDLAIAAQQALQQAQLVPDERLRASLDRWTSFRASLPQADGRLSFSRYSQWTKATSIGPILTRLHGRGSRLAATVPLIG